jgi:hypothetical protein
MEKIYEVDYYYQNVNGTCSGLRSDRKFIVADSSKQARSIVRSSVPQEETCKYGQLRLVIQSARRVRIQGYKINLEKISSD